MNSRHQALAPHLFSPYSLGPLELPSRIVMAPMTRCRSSQPGNIPNELMANYYAQRSHAGLIIAEATQISSQGQGYSFTPGIHTLEQIEGWKKVTRAVHDAGGRIFLQLWHVGRMSHAHFQDGGSPVAPSAIPVPDDTTVWLDPGDGKGGRTLPCTPPRALDIDEIRAIQNDYVHAVENALDAGFDGVELHGANGYLIDEFLRASSNQRSDSYGGSPRNRARFLLEIVERIAGIFPPGGIGLRLSPHNQSRGMNDPDTPATVLSILPELERLGLGYVHFAEVDWDAAPDVPLDFRIKAREAFRGTLIVAGKFDQAKASWILAEGFADLVAFGRPFIANPDLPARLQHGWPLAELKPDHLFGGDSVGYTDFPPFTQSVQERPSIPAP
ncbi:N-ethylmaleimide reductase [Haloferula luteola]|uniref:N-ethylmaleimide reductase n=1 Tax=Haloferula luteola TaxID=595692 RepID=A0A840UZH9_9BACT|nr:alkene reductase [Haloferula luteola]MBB5350236.1 N-ethylmaleimide reductase [Haloferula luteola]